MEWFDKPVCPCKQGLRNRRHDTITPTSLLSASDAVKPYHEPSISYDVYDCCYLRLLLISLTPVPDQLLQRAAVNFTSEINIYFTSEINVKLFFG